MKCLACIMLFIGLACTAKAQPCPGDSAEREIGIGLNVTTSLYYLVNKGYAFEPELRYTVLPGLFDLVVAPGYTRMRSNNVFINWDYHLKAFI